MWGNLENPVAKDVLDPKVGNNPKPLRPNPAHRLCRALCVCVSGDKGDSVGCSGPPGDKGHPGDFGLSGDDLVLVLQQSFINKDA